MARLKGRRTTARNIEIRGEKDFDMVPEFEAPELDLDRLAALTQRFAAPGVRSLREAFTQQTRGSRFQPAPLRGQGIRAALRGFGSGLSETIGGARRSALGAILPEFEGQREEARIRHQDLLREREFGRSRELEEENFRRRLEFGRRNQPTFVAQGPRRPFSAAPVSRLLQPGAFT